MEIATDYSNKDLEPPYSIVWSIYRFKALITDIQIIDYWINQSFLIGWTVTPSVLGIYHPFDKIEII